MKKEINFSRLVLSCMVMLLCLSACKTNEDNYRAAYEIARQQQQGDIDDETYSLIKKEAMPEATVVNGDTLRIKTDLVSLYVDKAVESDAKMMPFNVVVGKFRQVFNAKAMRDRLIAAGYKSYIIENREPSYYVVAVGCDTRDAAADAVKQIENDGNLVTKLPFPWVLMPVGFR